MIYSTGFSRTADFVWPGCVPCLIKVLKDNAPRETTTGRVCMAV